MKQNNKGYSLVELIIAFALLMIISASVVAFLRVSSHAYYSVSSSVSLQVKSQVTATQLQNYVIDCNGGIYFDSAANTLYVVNSEDAGFVAHVFRLDSSENSLYYGKNTVQLDGSTVSLLEAPAGETEDLLARDVSAFSVQVPGGANPSSVSLTLVLSRNGKTQTSSQTISLRNRPSTAGSLSALLAAVCLT